jgi:mono/diheme cytochrome c family protein
MIVRPLIAIAALLCVVGSAAYAADGATVYKEHCAKCHGDTGKADAALSKAMKVPPIVGDAKIQKMSEAEVAAHIKSNEKHPPTLKSLSDADINAAAAFVKQLAGK